MKFTDKKLLIFDLDGTLIDSVPDLASALNDMLRALNRATFSEEIIRSWVGNGAKTLVKRALSSSVDIDKNIDDTLFNHALSIFLDAYTTNVCVHTTLYANVKDTLIKLHNNNYTMAIVTNKPFDFIAPILKKLEIENYFTLNLGADSLPKQKPDAMPLLHVCNVLHVEPKYALMIGDSKNDILAAKAANIESIGVTYGYNYDENIANFRPEVIVDDFKNILSHLEIKE